MIEPGSLDEARAALAAGATLVTASARQARYLLEEQGVAELAQGRQAWRPGDILPWDAWLCRLHAAALAAGAGEVPALLSETQSLLLWQQIIEDDLGRRADGNSGWLLQPMAAARLAAEARQLALGWGLHPARVQASARSEDSSAFLRWSRSWERELATGSWLEPGALAEAAAGWLAGLPALRPAALWLAGFEELTPQQYRLCAAVAALGIPVRDAGFPAVATTTAQQLACDDPDHEAAAAAAWARGWLERQPTARLAIVVPDLAGRRSALERALAAALDPQAYWGETRSAPPWNLSLGRPLLDLPLVHDALLLLELGHRDLDFPAASRLLRSPYLGDPATEASQRLAVDQRLRQQRLLRVGFGQLRLVARAAGAPGFAARLDALAAAGSGQQPRPPDAWVEDWAARLQAGGWPGTSPLGSAEHQALQAWLSLLREFVALGGVSGPMDGLAALDWLRRMAAARLFQPQGASAPLQVLGMLEALGQRFDAIWLMGLHDEAWPAAPRPNPLLPLRQQRELGLPRASAARELEFATRMTALLRQSAPEVIASWPRQADQQALRPSPLIADWPRIECLAGDNDGLRNHIFQSSAEDLEEYVDDLGPPLDPAATELRGGSRVLVDQSQCPFRAFAAHRLGARALEEPGPGVDAAGRGLLVHAALEHLWSQVDDSSALAALDEAGRQGLIRTSVRSALDQLARSQPALAETRYRELEQVRLERLLAEWLATELARDGFQVLAREQRLPITAGALRLEGRVDRIDQLADGTRVLIDYKTGKLSPTDWLGERPRDFQLPLYATALTPAPDALAVAQLRAGACGWSGLARDQGLLAGLKVCGQGRRGPWAGLDWDSLLEHWRRVTLTLAEEVLTGQAQTAPQAGACRYCDLTILCRINEMKGAFSGHFEDTGEADDDEQPAG